MFGCAASSCAVRSVQEAIILRSLERVAQGRLARYDMDEFIFNISVSEPPHIQNDTITINRRQATDHQVRGAPAAGCARALP